MRRKNMVNSRYMDKMGKIGLLTREGEVHLARLVKYGTEEEALEARNDLVTSNLRFVVSVAAKYGRSRMSLMELIQEGNLGLLRAVEKFDHTKGYRFSTYANFWIRQTINRALSNHGRTIRIPVYYIEIASKLRRVTATLESVLGHPPSAEELAEVIEIPVWKVREIIRISREPLSLHHPNEEGRNTTLCDFVEDRTTPSPEKEQMRKATADQIRRLMKSFSPKEELILRRRFGLG